MCCKDAHLCLIKYTLAAAAKIFKKRERERERERKTLAASFKVGIALITMGAVAEITAMTTA